MFKILLGKGNWTRQRRFQIKYGYSIIVYFQLVPTCWDVTILRTDKGFYYQSFFFKKANL